MNTTSKTRKLTLLGVLIAIEVVLVLSGIGLMQLPLIKATTLHIPVIVGALLLGPTEGIILGAAFGILSVMMNTTQPNLTSFVFSPFIPGGNIWSLFIAMVPRILIGVTSYYVYSAIAKRAKQKLLPYIVGAAVGALTNTVLVMGSIYVIFGEQYAAAKSMPYSELAKFVMGIVGTNGVGEMIAAIILVPAICIPIRKTLKYNK